MPRKSKPYSIVYNRKFLMCDSLLDLKTGISEEEWQMVTEHTVDFYAQLYAIYKSKNQTLQLNKNDIKMMRALRRSINFIKTLDPATYTAANFNDRLTVHKASVTEEVEHHKPTIKISMDDQSDGDIIVSRLDG